MFNNLRKIRNEIVSKGDMSLYSAVLDFFYDPTESLQNAILERSKEYESDFASTLKELIKMYMTKKSMYREKILHGQVILWKEIYECVEKLNKNKTLIERSDCGHYGNDYLKVNDDLKEILSFYIKSQAAVSQLEEHLGLDRYLDRIAEFELSAINKMLDEQKRLTHEKIKPFIQQYQLDWGNDNIPSIVYHKLYKYNNENELCTLLKTNQKHVLLFVIDGLGWCQFQWHKLICREDGNYAYKESIFDWLEKTGNSKELILGTPLITDTAAGLTQIYTGKKSSETGVFSSKFKGTYRIEDTKRLTEQEMDKYFETDMNCMTSVLNTMGIASEMLYCTKYDERNTGFSNYLYNHSSVKQILPPERVYNVLLNRIKNEELKPFSGIYMTAIDNTGHTMGAFSKLEKYEHKKMDFLFKNFLLELADTYPNKFDGQTSILIIADHGMAETSNRMIYRREIENALRDYGNIWIVVNNRSCFIYGLDERDYDNAKKSVENFLNKKGIEAEVMVKNEARVVSNFPAENHKSYSIIPDLIISLIDNALFYHSNNIDEELFHFAGHGGTSINEKFVPLIEINLTEKLLADINDRFIDMM